MVIPDAIRINDQDRPPLTNAETVGQGAFGAVRFAQLGQAVVATERHQPLVELFCHRAIGAVAVITDENLAAIGPHGGLGRYRH